MVGKKFSKLSKIGFSMECFRAGQNFPFERMAGYSPSNASISGTFLKFTNFLTP